MMIGMPYVSTLTYRVPGRSTDVVRQVVDVVRCDVPVEVDEGVPVAYRCKRYPQRREEAEVRAKAGVPFTLLRGHEEWTPDGPVLRGMTTDGLRTWVDRAVSTLGGLWWILDISPTQGAIEYPMTLAGVDATTAGVRAANPGAEVLYDDRMADALVARGEYEARVFLRDGEVWAVTGDDEPTWRVQLEPGREVHVSAYAAGPSDRVLGFPADGRDLAMAAARWLAARHRAEVVDHGSRLDHLGSSRPTPVEINLALALRACAVLRTGVNVDGECSRLPPAPWCPDRGWTEEVRLYAEAMVAALDRVGATRQVGDALAAMWAAREFMRVLPPVLPRHWVQARAFVRRSGWVLDLWDGFLSPGAAGRAAEPGRPRRRAA